MNNTSVQKFRYRSTHSQKLTLPNSRRRTSSIPTPRLPSPTILIPLLIPITPNTTSRRCPIRIILPRWSTPMTARTRSHNVTSRGTLQLLTLRFTLQHIPLTNPVQVQRARPQRIGYGHRMRGIRTRQGVPSRRKKVPRVMH